MHLNKVRKSERREDRKTFTIIGKVFPTFGLSDHYTMKIFLIGFMGSGKTHWGRLLSQKLSIPFFDLDEQVAEHAGKSIPEIFATEGEELFRLQEKDVLHLITESHESFVMACGGGSPCYFNNIEYMQQAGTTVWINTAPEILFQRLVKEKETRPLIKELSDVQLKSFISKKYADRRIYYEQADIKIDDEPLKLEKLIHKLFHV
jgi:shikimate kinase